MQMKLRFDFKKYFASILSLLCVPLLLTGCWDKVELENRGLVLAIGIDKYEENMKKPNENISKNGNPMRYTISLSLPDFESAVSNKGGSGSGEGESESADVKVANNETLSAGMRMIDSYSSRKLYFGHTKVIIFSEEFLNEETLLKEAIDALEKNNEINRKIIVLCTDKKAYEILNAKIANEPNLGLYISDFYKNNDESTSITIKQDLASLISNLRVSNDCLIPKITIENDKINIGEVCLVKDFKFFGWLDESLTMGYLWTKGTGKYAEVIVDFEDIFVPLRVSRNSTEIKFFEKDEKLYCNIDTLVSGTIEEFILTNQNSEENESMDELKRSYEKLVENEIISTAEYFQENGVDAFMFSETLRKFYYPLYLKYADGDKWEDNFKELVISTNATVEIDR